MAGTIPDGGRMTIFGIDISNNNGSDIDLSQVAAEGFTFVFCKVSEGNYFQDATWPHYRDAAKSAGLLVVGYHYAIASCDPASQVETFKGNGGGSVVMLDFEANSGGINDYWALVNAFKAAGIAVVLSYLPRWYMQQIGSPDLATIPNVISSSYVTGSGFAIALYPGDDSDYWAPYCGTTPTILQFSSSASVAGHTVDVNAFRGSRDQLAELLSGQPFTSAGEQMTPEQNQLLQETWDQLRGPDGHGWAQLGNRSIVDALAIIGQHLGIVGFGLTPPGVPA